MPFAFDTKLALMGFGLTPPQVALVESVEDDAQAKAKARAAAERRARPVPYTTMLKRQLRDAQRLAKRRAKL